MTRTIPAATARTQFGQILELVQTKGTRFVVSRNGQPAAVILAVEDYLESKLDTPEALAKLQAASRKRGLDLLSTSDIDAEIAGVRKERKHRRA